MLRDPAQARSWCGDSLPCLFVCAVPGDGRQACAVRWPTCLSTEACSGPAAMCRRDPNPRRAGLPGVAAVALLQRVLWPRQPAAPCRALREPCRRRALARGRAHAAAAARPALATARARALPLVRPGAVRRSRLGASGRRAVPGFARRHARREHVLRRAPGRELRAAGGAGGRGLAGCAAATPPAPRPHGHIPAAARQSRSRLTRFACRATARALRRSRTRAQPLQDVCSHQSQPETPKERVIKLRGPLCALWACASALRECEREPPRASNASAHARQARTTRRTRSCCRPRRRGCCRACAACWPRQRPRRCWAPPPRARASRSAPRPPPRL